MNELSRLAALVVVTLSLASVACTAAVPSESEIAEVAPDLNEAIAANAIGDIKAVVVTKCIRTYEGSCDAFKINCKRSGGKLEGSVPGESGELFVWTCTK